ncbi:MAG: hypothetical protein AAGE65_01480 [Planctomycetota bacterium]
MRPSWRHGLQRVVVQVQPDDSQAQDTQVQLVQQHEAAASAPAGAGGAAANRLANAKGKALSSEAVMIDS